MEWSHVSVLGIKRVSGIEPVVYSKRSKNPGLTTGRLATPTSLVQT